MGCPVSVGLGGLIIGLVTLTGCQVDSEGHQHTIAFHKPSDYGEAVVRLREIHDTLVDATKLPDPRQFDSSGVSPHSAMTTPSLVSTTELDTDERSDRSPDSTNGMDNMQSDGETDEFSIQAVSKSESISIPMEQELRDIIRWLPAIAAASSLPKAVWDLIHEDAQRLDRLIQSRLRVDGASFLLDYQANATEFETILTRLESYVPDFYQWQAKHPL